MKVKRWIERRARALGATDLLPDEWTETVAEADLSQEQIRYRVEDALNDRYEDALPLGVPMPDYQACSVVAMYDDRVVYSVMGSEGGTFQATYAVADDGTVTLGDPTEVVATYSPVATAVAEAIHADGGPLIEQVGKSGRQWDVLLIQTGLSKNRTYYPAATLEKATPLFEGVAAYADHTPNRAGGRSIRDKVGTFADPAFGTWDVGGQKVEGVKARFTVVAPWLREVLLEAAQAGQPDFIGFSIDAGGRVVQRTHAGQQVKWVEELTHVNSVDAVAEPSAGGRVVRLVAGAVPPEEDGMGADEIKALVEQLLREGLGPAVAAAVQEAVKPPVPETPPTPPAPELPPSPPDPPGPPAEIAAIREEVASLRKADAKRAAMADLVTKLAGTNLSDLTKQRISKDFADLFERRAWTPEELDARIQEDIAFEAALVGGRHLPVSVSGTRITEAPFDKFTKGLLGLLGDPDNVQMAFRDLREAYARFNGIEYLDVDVREMFADFRGSYDSSIHHKRLQEAATTASWSNTFADNLYVMMLKLYKANPYYDLWKPLCSEIENAPDFQTRHWTRLGGYGDLATVAEQATYPLLTSPGDEEVSYAVSKKGGIDSVTLEMLTYDRGAARVRQMPLAMARSAARTLYKFVYNQFTTTNPTMSYDSVALYNSAHGNTGTTALSVAGLNTTQIAMRNQTAYGESNEILGVRNKIRFLIVPNTLEMVARRVTGDFAPNANYNFAISSTPDADGSLDPTSFHGMGIQVLVYDQLTDATDWWAVANPAEVNTAVIGFWNGQQEPELFVQDNASIGSVFSSDQVSWKIRHVYGAVIGDHRSMYRQVVAG